MAIPDFQSTMLPLLKCLSDKKEHRINEVVEKLSQYFKLTEEEKNIFYPNGSERIFSNKVRWANQHLKNAGLTSNPYRGVWVITKNGLKVLKSKPESINIRYLKDLDFSKFIYEEIPKEENKLQKILEDYTPNDLISFSRTELSQQLEKDLLTKIFAKDDKFFEKLVAFLIYKMGYGGSVEDIIQCCGGKGDGGIDGIIKQDVLGVDKIRIQAKCYALDHSVGSSEIRDFCGSLYNVKNPKGIFITTSYFTKSALECGEKNGMILIDGKRLLKLLVDYNIGVNIKETFSIKQIDEDFFENFDL